MAQPDIVSVFISHNVAGVASFLVMPLALIFFGILIAAFVGYFAMKNSIYGSLIFMLIVMVASLVLLEAIILMFI